MGQMRVFGIKTDTLLLGRIFVNKGEGLLYLTAGRTSEEYAYEVKGEIREVFGEGQCIDLELGM